MKNFLTKKQIEDLQAKDWEVSPLGFFIDLYRDEFDHDVWEQICDQAQVEYDIDKLTILSFGTMVNAD